MSAADLTTGNARNGSGGPMFRTTIIAKLLQDHLDTTGESLRTVSQRSNVPARTLQRILAGERVFVSLAVADDVLTHGLGDSSLFHHVPELEAVYRS